MNWARAKWRKIYCRPIGRRMAMSMSASLLYNELIRYAEDDGTLWVGGAAPESIDQAVAVLGRRMAVSLPDRRLMRAAMVELLKLGAVTTTDLGHLRIEEFAEHVPRSDGRWKKEPWRKMYCEETQSFLRLSVFARGLAADLLRLCDDTGTVFHGGDMVSHLLGLCGWLATKHHKPQVRRWIDELLADGYLQPGATDGTHVIKNFEMAQPRAREPSANRPRDGHELDAKVPSTVREPSASVPRTGREPAANLPRGGHEIAPNGAESFTTAITVGSDLIRSEGMDLKEEEERRPPPSPDAPSAPAPEPAPEALLYLPCYRSKDPADPDPERWALTRAELAALEDAFPGYDLLPAIRKAAHKYRHEQPPKLGIPHKLRRFIEVEQADGRLRLKPPPEPAHEPLPPTPPPSPEDAARAATEARRAMEERERGFARLWLEKPRNARLPLPPQALDPERAPFYDAEIRALLRELPEDDPIRQSAWLVQWQALHPRDPALRVVVKAAAPGDAPHVAPERVAAKMVMRPIRRGGRATG